MNICPIGLRNITGACLALSGLLAASPSNATGLRTLARFTLSNGANPSGALTIVPSGAALPAGTLLGTTQAGGYANRGTTFAITPPASGSNIWSLNTISSFQGRFDVAAPIGSLTLLANGTMAGAAEAGGPDWSGGIFTIAPVVQASRQTGSPPNFGTFLFCIARWSTWLHVSPNKLPPGVKQYCVTISASSEQRSPDAPPRSVQIVDPGIPAGPPLADGSGGLYSAASSSSPGGGAVIHLTPPATSGHLWTQAIIFVFGQTAGDVSAPSGPVIFGPGGDLLGAAEFGGAHGAGGIYRLKPPAKAGGKWTEDVIWSFGGAGDGSYPSGAVLPAADGELFGTTTGGGAGYGTVFKLARPASGTTAWQETVLYEFAGNTGGRGDGATPVAGVSLDRGGNLYGTTRGGGAHFNGAVFELTKPAAGGTAWQESLLWSFTGGGDGAVPLGGLVVDSSGHLYGTTSLGGMAGAAVENALEFQRGYGTVFELNP